MMSDAPDTAEAVRTAAAPAATVRVEDVLPEAAAFVYELLSQKLPDTLLFHSYQHTVDVVEVVLKIARKDDRPDEERDLVALAAWFHDTGFTETYEGHEEVSVRIATTFLRERGLPDKTIDRVADLIRSTHPDREPRDGAEALLHDADYAHLGRKKFFERAERLRREWERHLGRTYSEREWTELQLRFLHSVSYLTDYGSKKYGKRKRKNAIKLQHELAARLDAEKPLPPSDDLGRPKRGIETLFRTGYRNHINLSSIADAKANIMISINAILMSIIVSFISTRLQADTWLLAPAAALLVSSLASIIFAILSARPEVTSKIFTIEDVMERKGNILFFGNFVNMSPADFRVGMRQIMDDYDRLYDSMINDLYSLGEVLSRKYRLLYISYTVFMAGLVITVLLFLFFFFVMPNL